MPTKRQKTQHEYSDKDVPRSVTASVEDEVNENDNSPLRTVIRASEAPTDSKFYKDAEM